MVAPASGLFVPTFVTGLNGTIVLNLDLETHRMALFTDAVVAPDLTVNTAYGVAPWLANEVVGTGYTAGGVVLINTVWVHGTGGVVKWDFDDPQWTVATFTSRGGLSYADALVGNQAIMFQNWGADVPVSNGTFQVQIALAGAFTVDLVP